MTGEVILYLVGKAVSVGIVVAIIVVLSWLILRIGSE